MIGWEKHLGIAVIAQAVTDLLEEAPRKDKRDEKRRIEAQESAKAFLSGGPDLNYWCAHAQIEPATIIFAAGRLNGAGAEVREKVKALLANVLLRPNCSEGGEGDGDGAEYMAESEVA